MLSYQRIFFYLSIFTKTSHIFGMKLHNITKLTKYQQQQQHQQLWTNREKLISSNKTRLFLRATTSTSVLSLTLLGFYSFHQVHRISTLAEPYCVVYRIKDRGDIMQHKTLGKAFYKINLGMFLSVSVLLLLGILFGESFPK